MQIRDLGEFGLIDRLIAMATRQRGGPDHGAPLGFRLTVDAGDDTAAWRTGAATELFTTDTMVEGVHFTRETTPWRDLGWKSMASNISDIAAMGGLPTFALVTLGLPPETAVADIEELYRGMLEINRRHGVSIVGGDMVRSPVVFITVALTGVHPGQPLLRSTARPGDQVGVTGYVGSAGGGLRMMLEHLPVTPEAAEHLRQAHRRPQPAVAQGRILAEAGVRTAMDISDGLAGDLAKLCKASGVAARIFAGQVPMHSLLRQAFPDRCLDLALGGGEDYLLLFTAPPALMAMVLPRLPQGAAVIGEVLAGPPGHVDLVDLDGVATAAGAAGWDHFTGDPHAAPART
jgi:thiamine-monophosphate kinase